MIFRAFFDSWPFTPSARNGKATSCVKKSASGHVCSPEVVQCEGKKFRTRYPASYAASIPGKWRLVSHELRRTSLVSTRAARSGGFIPRHRAVWSFPGCKA